MCELITGSDRSNYVFRGSKPFTSNDGSNVSLPLKHSNEDVYLVECFTMYATSGGGGIHLGCRRSIRIKLARRLRHISELVYDPGVQKRGNFISPLCSLSDLPVNRLALDAELVYWNIRLQSKSSHYVPTPSPVPCNQKHAKCV